MVLPSSHLSDCLADICLLVESALNIPNVKSCIQFLDDNCLYTAASPSMPKTYVEALNGLEIGARVGSCGTAAFTKKEVNVKDLEFDPLWEKFKELALENGLRSCWSIPIISSQDRVIGTFAIYNLGPTQPTVAQEDLIQRFIHLARLEIENFKADLREKELVQALQHSQDKFQALTKVIPDLALVISEDGTYTDIYGAVSTLLAKPLEAVIGKNISDVLPDKTAKIVLQEIKQAVESEGLRVFEYELDVLKGRCYFEGRITQLNHYFKTDPDKRHVLWMARDISAFKAAEEKIKKLAYYDPLTSLPNRRLLLDRLNMLVEHTRRNKNIGVLLYLDLDKFKEINDSKGHALGDELLIATTQRLESQLRSSDTLARIGGDEFVVLLETLELKTEDISDHASHVASKLIKAIEEPFIIDSTTYQVGVSIGICLIDGQDTSAAEALQRADIAMYSAKKQGGNSYIYFDSDLQRETDQRQDFGSEMLKSIEQGDFCAYFQPQIDNQGTTVGAEALIRWEHPEHGSLPPLKFIPIASQQGLIGKLQEVVLKNSCEILNKLKRLRLLNDNFTISINLSDEQFKNRALHQELLATLNQYCIQARQLKLEVTETMLVENVEHTNSQMLQLKKEGFRLSIDDFGSGNSPLSYLRHFPTDELKIDKVFVDDVHQNKVSLDVVDALIAMSHHLGYGVIAEGVEFKEQLEVLSTRSLQATQGYFLARPLPADMFIDWMSSNSTDNH